MNARFKNSKNAFFYAGAILFFICSCNRPNKKELGVRLFDKKYPPLNYRLTGCLIDGRKNGLWTKYDSSGSIQTQQTFVDGEEFGTLKEFSQNKLIGETKDTIINSDTISYFKRFNFSGNIVISGQYKNGKQVGEWLFYFENGKDLKLKLKFSDQKIDTIYKSTNYFDGVR